MARRLALIPALCLLACQPPEEEPAPFEAPPGPSLQHEGKADQIGPTDDPSYLWPGASRRLRDLISPADIGRNFGRDDNDVPYPDTEWPWYAGGTDQRWSGDPTPLAKYMSIVDPPNAGAAKDWEHDNHGPAIPDLQPWYGHCNGWSAAAILNHPVLHPVYAAANGPGRVRACQPGSPGCVRFEIGDINALEAEAYFDGPANFVGARCDTPPNQLRFDADGRVVRTGSGCQGLNPGTLLMALGNLMKRMKYAFVVDSQTRFSTNDIWNQPAYRYTVNDLRPLGEGEAARLVSDGRQSSYTWNPNARGFVSVDLSVWWVSEFPVGSDLRAGPYRAVVSGLSITHQTRLRAVIELDGDPGAAATQVIGGEYVGADRVAGFPFVWLPLGPGPEVISWPSRSTHNPYVRPSIVRALVALGRQ